MLKRYFLHLSYNGCHFHGWQIQPNAITVQETIEVVLSRYFGKKIQIIGCGRTDTEVNALNFYAHFDAEISIKNHLKIIYNLNCMLPESIAIYDFFEVPQNWHTRFDAQKRTYEYHFAIGKNPFNDKHAYLLYQPLDINQLNKLCMPLFNNTDFACFSKSKTDVKTTICTIYEAKWQYTNSHYLIFTISANRFLRNMVRAITGTILELYKQNRKPEDLQKIIESKDRSCAGYSVPGYALYLSNIIYPYFNKKSSIRFKK